MNNQFAGGPARRPGSSVVLSTAVYRAVPRLRIAGTPLFELHGSTPYLRMSRLCRTAVIAPDMACIMPCQDRCYAERVGGAGAVDSRCRNLRRPSLEEVRY